MLQLQHLQRVCGNNDAIQLDVDLSVSNYDSHHELSWHERSILSTPDQPLLDRRHRQVTGLTGERFRSWHWILFHAATTFATTLAATRTTTGQLRGLATNRRPRSQRILLVSPRTAFSPSTLLGFRSSIKGFPSACDATAPRIHSTFNMTSKF